MCAEMNYKKTNHMNYYIQNNQILSCNDVLKMHDHEVMLKMCNYLIKKSAKNIMYSMKKSIKRPYVIQRRMSQRNTPNLYRKLLKRVFNATVCNTQCDPSTLTHQS